MLDSLGPHELQHIRLLCPPLSPRVCSNPCPLSKWCYLPISSSVAAFSFCFQSFPVSGFCFFFSPNGSLPKYWSFSFSNSPSKEYSGLISFRIGWFDLLAVQGTLKSLLQHHNSKASILWCSAFFIDTSLHDYWKNHSFDYMNLCWQSDVSAF